GGGPEGVPLRPRRRHAAGAGQPHKPAGPGEPDLAAVPGSGPVLPHGPQPLAASAGGRPPATPLGPRSGAWVSPADEGWRAAERLTTTPGESATTSAGLPIRVPMAHYVPGAAPTPIRQTAPVQAPGQA